MLWLYLLLGLFSVAILKKIFSKKPAPSTESSVPAISIFKEKYPLLIDGLLSLKNAKLGETTVHPLGIATSIGSRLGAYEYTFFVNT